MNPNHDPETGRFTDASISYRGRTLWREGSSSNPANMGEETFKKRTPKGYSYSTSNRIAGRRVLFAPLDAEGIGKTELTNEFFAGDKGFRNSLIHHEIGHDIASIILAKGNFDEVKEFKPFRKSQWGYDYSGAGEQNPSELLADMTGDVFTGLTMVKGTDDPEKKKQLVTAYRYITKTAREAGYRWTYKHKKIRRRNQT